MAAAGWLRYAEEFADRLLILTMLDNDDLQNGVGAAF